MAMQSLYHLDCAGCGMSFTTPSKEGDCPYCKVSYQIIWPDETYVNPPKNVAVVHDLSGSLTGNEHQK